MLENWLTSAVASGDAGINRYVRQHHSVLNAGTNRLGDHCCKPASLDRLFRRYSKILSLLNTRKRTISPASPDRYQR